MLKGNILFFKDGKYISADGMFVEVVNKRKNIYLVKNVNTKKEFYFITDGKFTHSHGDSLKTCKRDFEFKVISEKLKKEPITKDTLFTVQYYRLVTGACDFGVRQWLDSNKIAYEIVDGKTIEKKPMKANELLPILRKSNAYGLQQIEKLLTF